MPPGKDKVPEGLGFVRRSLRLKQKHASERRIGEQGVERASLGGAVEGDFLLGVKRLHEVQRRRPVGERGGLPGEGGDGARVETHGGRGEERREAFR